MEVMKSCLRRLRSETNLLFAINLGAGFQRLLLLNFCEGKILLYLLQWSSTAFTNDFRALESSLQPRLYGRKRGAGVHCTMMQTLMQKVEKKKKKEDVSDAVVGQKG